MTSSRSLNALWGASLPVTDARLDLGAGRLGVVLLALAAGALVTVCLRAGLAGERDRRDAAAGGRRAALVRP